MADIGFRVSRVNRTALTNNKSDLAFSSSFPMDRIVAISIGVNAPHGLNYKPTLLAFKSTGSKDIVAYVDNYQINNAVSTTKGIALSQQGT